MKRELDETLPPHSVEAEQGVLGCIMLSPVESLEACATQLRAGSAAFYDVRHQTLYGTMVRMWERQQAVDVITVQQQLKDDGQLENCGGVAYLAGLPDMVPSAANLPTYLGVVRDKHLMRRMLGTFTNAIGRIYAHEGGVEALLSGVAEEVSRLTEQETPARAVHIRELLLRNVAQLDEWHYSRGHTQVIGLSTGPDGNYTDKMLGGISSEDLGIIAGRPGTGKTSLAMNWVKWAARQHVWWERTAEFHPLEEGETEPRPVMKKHEGVPVAVFSLEMTADSLSMRLLFDEADIDMGAYRTGYVKGTAEDLQRRLVTASGRLAKANIYIDDASGCTMAQIAAKARQLARTHGIKLFVLDYIQLIRSAGEGGDNRVRELEKVADKLVELKKQLKVPWLVLAQMNRNIETADRERFPVMSDLKDCGALEQAADWVLFTHKTPNKQITAPRKMANGVEGPSEYELLQEIAAREKWTWGETPDRVSLVVAKHRDGPTGVVETVFVKNKCRFEDWHLFLLKHGATERKAGESRHLGQSQFEGTTEDFPTE